MSFLIIKTGFIMDYRSIINQYYPEENELKKILLKVLQIRLYRLWIVTQSYNSTDNSLKRRLCYTT